VLSGESASLRFCFGFFGVNECNGGLSPTMLHRGNHFAVRRCLIRRDHPRIHFIAGGFHFVVAPDPDIEKIVTGLHDRFKVEYVAPAHCTGEPAFTALRKVFGDHYLYAGLGTTLTTTHAGQP
jgi:metal-dependent hydrolase (beta-lactamase superfamily II)